MGGKIKWTVNWPYENADSSKTLEPITERMSIDMVVPNAVRKVTRQNRSTSCSGSICQRCQPAGLFNSRYSFQSELGIIGIMAMVATLRGTQQGAFKNASLETQVD